MYYRTDSWLAPSQWETWLQSNTVYHWLGANLKSVLYQLMGWKITIKVPFDTPFLSLALLPEIGLNRQVVPGGGDTTSVIRNCPCKNNTKVSAEANMMPCPYISLPQGYNTLSPEQNGSHFADHNSKCSFWLKMSLFWLKFHWNLLLRSNWQ